MSQHRALNWILAIIIALLLSSTCLLDGPTEHEATLAVQADLREAIALANTTKEAHK